MTFCGEVGGGFVVDVLAEAGAMQTSGARLDLRLLVGGVPSFTREGDGPSPISGFLTPSVNDYARSVGWAVSYFPPAVGPLTLELQGKASTNLRLRDLRVMALLP